MKNSKEVSRLHLEPFDTKESPEDRSRTECRFLEEMAAIEAEGDFVEYLP